MRTVITIGFFFLVLVLNAQSDFRAGYVIENATDTIFGEIDYRGDLIMSSTCKFKDQNKKVQSYSPTDISGFRFIDGKYYVSREVDSKTVFLEYLIKGQVSIYYQRDDAGDHYYIESKNEGLTEIPYEEGVKMVDNKQMYYATTRHTGLLAHFMIDAPNFQKRIQSIKKPEHRTLIKLAKDYHYAVCDNEECIIYERKQPFLRMSVEGIMGRTKFASFRESNIKSDFQTGIITRLGISRINEKLHLRTGLIYGTIEIDTTRNSIYKIPLQIEYHFPLSGVTPRIASGINFYSRGDQVMSVLGGVDLRLYKSVNLSINYEIDFNSQSNETIPLLPNNVFSRSVFVGMLIKL